MARRLSRSVDLEDRAAKGARRDTATTGSVGLDQEFETRGLISENHSGLAEAVAALPPRRRLIVFLHYFADLAYPEIAKLCGVSDGTVAATLAQARAELYELLDKEVSS